MKIKELQDKCSSYKVLAFNSSPKTSLIENRDPFLKRLSDLKSFDDRVEFAGEKFEKLGEGSARAVFKISDELILKVALNPKGLAQNQNESKWNLQKSCAISIIAHDPDGKWLIGDFTNDMSKDDFKHIIGYGFNEFINSLFYTFNNESDAFKKPQKYEDIKKHSLFKCLSEMIVDGSLLIGDLDKVSSFGIKDGKILLRDAGLSKSIYQKFYSDKSSSS
jgi:hypothetical protein